MDPLVSILEGAPSSRAGRRMGLAICTLPVTIQLDLLGA
jgi:hypothetical protein